MMAAALTPPKLSLAGKNSRLGLRGMKEQVEMVGGTFHLKSATGHGTTVGVVFKNPASGIP